MAGSDRKEFERVLLAEAVDKGSIGFLEAEGITLDHFYVHKNVATELWGEQIMPSRRIVEGWDESSIEDWEPSSDEVPYALDKIRELYAQEKFHKLLYEIKDHLREQDGWKRALDELPDKLTIVQGLLERGKESVEGLIPWLDTGEIMLNGVEIEQQLLRGLILMGKAHLFFGQNDSGKSWIAKWIAKEAMDRGLRVIYFDYENTALTFAIRQTILGVRPEQATNLLKYAFAPPLTMDKESTQNFVRILDAVNPDLIIWDSWAGALGSCGMSEDSNDDVQHWASKYIAPAKARDISTIILDHTGHENTDRPRGARRKMDEMDIMWKVHKKQHFNSGKRGKVELTNKKDRLSSLLPKIVFDEIGGTPFRCEPLSLDELDWKLTENGQKLRRFVEKHPEGITWTQMVNFLGSKGSTSRAVSELKEHNLLGQDEETKKYHGTPGNLMGVEQNPLGFQDSNEVPDPSEPEGNGRGSTRGGVYTPPMEPHAENDDDPLASDEHDLLGNNTSNPSNVTENEEVLEAEGYSPRDNGSTPPEDRSSHTAPLGDTLSAQGCSRPNCSQVAEYDHPYRYSTDKLCREHYEDHRQVVSDW